MATITITRRLSDSEDPDQVDAVYTQVSGEPRLVEALGMLEMAKNTFLSGDLDS
ncbi:hypothetical protein [Aeromicrobium sp. Leaf291]|uniref:hypothetical protein n=1 Tax=Aeromicrobium sp. Leaf291 TaxID=1736325 RepID=UPI0012E13C94|nr:hypothetical protein [Aeromicrobium sp. Leaf291]